MGKKISVTSLGVPKLRIVDVVETVTLQMLWNTWKEIEHRLDILRVKIGAHVELDLRSAVLILHFFYC